MPACCAFVASRSTLFGRELILALCKELKQNYSFKVPTGAFVFFKRT